MQQVVKADDIRFGNGVIQKVSWRIVPFIMVLYFIAFLDRVNIGFASLEMNRDIGLSNTVYGLGAGIFFLGYFLFEVPSNLILNKLGARVWIARVMITWGIVSGAMAFVQGPISFYILRFLLGAAEAGFFPGIILYLSFWFPMRARAGVTALFMAAAPLSTALGSPISGALMQMNGIMGYAGWQWMFILEAIPAVILGIIVIFYMTDQPEKAKWLDNNERAWLMDTMANEQRSKQAYAKHSIWAGLADIRVLSLAIIYFGTSAGFYTLSIWAPQIIKTTGIGSLQIGFVNAIPAVFAIVAMFLWARHSDKTNERTWHVVIACFVAACGLVLATTVSSIIGIIFTLTIVNIGISCSKPPMWSMPTVFLSGSAAAAGIATINSIGNLGGFLGPTMIGWLRDQTDSFSWGLYFVASLLVVSCILTIILAATTKLPK